MSMALRCKNNNLPVTRSVQTGHIPHWEGTSKGLINICVERGLVPLQKMLVRGRVTHRAGTMAGFGSAAGDFLTIPCQYIWWLRKVLTTYPGMLHPPYQTYY